MVFQKIITYILFAFLFPVLLIADDEARDQKYKAYIDRLAEYASGHDVDERTIKTLADGMVEAGQLKKALTDAEAKLFSEYPDRVPRLKEIADYAGEAAKAEHAKYDRVPEDAYKHVLWSYLLTKEFGEEFALSVTEAHETGDTQNTTAEHIKDRANNKLGRLYAAEGKGEDDIVWLVMTDPRVQP